MNETECMDCLEKGIVAKELNILRADNEMLRAKVEELRKTQLLPGCVNAMRKPMDNHLYRILITTLKNAGGEILVEVKK